MAVNPAQVEKFLQGADYPLTKQGILDLAQENGADKNVLDTLSQIPDREYDGPVGISQELGRIE